MEAAIAAPRTRSTASATSAPDAVSSEVSSGCSEMDARVLEEFAPAGKECMA